MKKTLTAKSVAFVLMLSWLISIISVFPIAVSADVNSVIVGTWDGLAAALSLDGETMIKLVSDIDKTVISDASVLVNVSGTKTLNLNGHNINVVNEYVCGANEEGVGYDPAFSESSLIGVPSMAKLYIVDSENSGGIRYSAPMYENRVDMPAYVAAAVRNVFSVSDGGMLYVYGGCFEGGSVTPVFLNGAQENGSVEAEYSGYADGVVHGSAVVVGNSASVCIYGGSFFGYGSPRSAFHYDSSFFDSTKISDVPNAAVKVVGKCTLQINDGIFGGMCGANSFYAADNFETGITVRSGVFFTDVSEYERGADRGSAWSGGDRPLASLCPTVRKGIRGYIGLPSSAVSAYGTEILLDGVSDSGYTLEKLTTDGVVTVRPISSVQNYAIDGSISADSTDSYLTMKYVRMMFGHIAVRDPLGRDNYFYSVSAPPFFNEGEEPKVSYEYIWYYCGMPITDSNYDTLNIAAPLEYIDPDGKVHTVKLKEDPGVHIVTCVLTEYYSGTNHYTVRHTAEAVTGFVSDSPECPHKFYVLTNTATCTSEGFERKICTLCGYETYEHVNVGDHVAIEYYAYNDAYHWNICKFCYSIISAQEKHDFETLYEKEATCLSRGNKIMSCKECEMVIVKTGETLADHTRVYITNDSMHSIICSDCGNTLEGWEEHGYYGLDSVSGSCFCEHERNTEVEIELIGHKCPHGLSVLAINLDFNRMDREFNDIVKVPGALSYKWEHNGSTLSEEDYIMLSTSGPVEANSEITVSILYEGRTIRTLTFTTNSILEKDDKAANCTESGYEPYKTCSECNSIVNDENRKSSISYIPKTPHIYDDSCDSTCNVCGYYRENVHAYKNSWSITDNAHYHECIYCGSAKKDEAPHTMVFSIPKQSTCVEEGIASIGCDVCGMVIQDIPILKSAHRWRTDKPHASVDATCETDGSVTYKCGDCDETISHAIPATGHLLLFTEAVQPTCSNEGRKAHYSCIFCNGAFSDENAQKVCDPKLPVSSDIHSGSAEWISDIDTHIRFCSDCGEVDVEKAQHSFNDKNECTVCRYRKAVTDVRSASVSIDLPTDKAVPPNTAFPSDESYTVTVLGWQLMSDAEPTLPLVFGETTVLGRPYTVYLAFTSTDGFGFSDNTEFKLSDGTVLTVIYREGSECAVCTATLVCREAEVEVTTDTTDPITTETETEQPIQATTEPDPDLTKPLVTATATVYTDIVWIIPTVITILSILLLLAVILLVVKEVRFKKRNAANGEKKS